MECLAGAISTGVVAAIAGFATRKRLLGSVRSATLLRELERRGFDIEDHAMESYLKKTFEIIEHLGAGVSGQVWKIRKMKTGETFAMKKIQKRTRNGKRVQDEALENEINCLRKLRHPHIVNVMEVVESSSNLWIVMECAEGGELYKRIAELDHFSERSASRIVKQLLKAVHYMHSFGVVHRDLKLENILLTSTADDAAIKVADFGLAVISQHGLSDYRPDESMRMKDATFITEPFCGSPICMAPEVATRSAAYGPQCDMWSVGCITFELISGHPPFEAPTAAELFRLVHSSNGPVFSDLMWLDVSGMAKDIVTQMLAYLPKDRLSAREALHHSWFRSAPDMHMVEAHQSFVRRFSSAVTRTTASRMTLAGPRISMHSECPSDEPGEA